MTKPAGRHAAPPRRGAAAPPRRRHRRLRPVSKRGAAAVLLCGVLVVGIGACGLAVVSHPGHGALAVGRPKLLPVPRGRRAPVPQPSDGEKVARPATLIIPSIGVRTSLVRLGVTPSGALQVPGRATVAGWYTFSPRPGAIGSSIIAGHIDSRTGPGVFYRLRLMQPGQRVFVRRADHTLAVFRVMAKRMYPKA